MVFRRRVNKGCAQELTRGQTGSRVRAMWVLGRGKR